MRVRQWGPPDEPIPKHPYRNSAIFHLALAGMIVLVAWATGGTLSRALVFAVGFFLIATSWSWWRWRQRLQEERRKQEQRLRATGGAPSGEAQ